MEIYIADVSGFAEPSVFAEKMRLLPAERQEKIGRYRNREDQRRSLGAGLLLEYGLGRRGYTLLEDAAGKEQVHLAYGVHGKPYILEHPEICFNLSHAGGLAAAVFSDGPAGIDVEYIRSPGEALVKRIFSLEEQNALQRRILPAWMPEIREQDQAFLSDLIFTAIWTRKESYIKAVGEGLHLPLADFSVLGECVVSCRECVKDTGYQLRTWRTAAGLLSVCADGCMNAEPVSVELNEAL